ncbi:MAG: hypothetical protein PHI27_06630 [Eubacteriales bacterium]|nr:hypothetical protein [Eubacteriales bacterium]
MAVFYIRERNAFYNWLTMNHLSTTAQALWNALFTIYNAQGWPDGWIEAPDMLLRSYMHVSNDALLDARQQLKNKGLLDFIKGNRRASAARYRMIWLTLKEDEQTDDTDGGGYPQRYPQNIHNDGHYQDKAAKGADKQEGKEAAKGADKQEGKEAAKGAALNNTILDGVYTTDIPFSERVKIQQQLGFERAREEMPSLTYRQQSYVDWYAEFDNDPSRIAQFRYLLANSKFTFAQFGCALTFTQGKCERGKVSNPLEYLKTLLIDWDKRGLTERSQIEGDLTVDLIPTGYYGCKDWDETHDGAALSM